VAVGVVAIIVMLMLTRLHTAVWPPEIMCATEP
jgi:hypothetical protein